MKKINNIVPQDDVLIDPGTDPITDDLKAYDIKSDAEIANQKLMIQCTWANCFTEPIWNRGLCIRSYDRKMLARQKVSQDQIIGTTTGRYSVDNKEVVWLEASLLHCNRRKIGWFREGDIWHAKKGVVNNPDNKTVKKSNWLAWITGGITVLKLIS